MHSRDKLLCKWYDLKEYVKVRKSVLDKGNQHVAQVLPLSNNIRTWLKYRKRKKEEKNHLATISQLLIYA
jgi:hypothetical protein